MTRGQKTRRGGCACRPPSSCASTNSARVGSSRPSVSSGASSTLARWQLILWPSCPQLEVLQQRLELLPRLGRSFSFIDRASRTLRMLSQRSIASSRQSYLPRPCLAIRSLKRSTRSTSTRCITTSICATSKLSCTSLGACRRKRGASGAMESPRTSVVRRLNARGVRLRLVRTVISPNCVRSSLQIEPRRQELNQVTARCQKVCDRSITIESCSRSSRCPSSPTGSRA